MSDEHEPGGIDGDGPPGVPDETERLRMALAEADARARDAAAEADAMRAALSAAQDEAADLRSRLDGAAEARTAGAVRYRELLLRAEPDVPADLVSGDSIEAVDASFAAARETVARVRSHIDAQAHAARVPAGAPPRSAPDISSLTPEQKIRHGLQRLASG
jgi:hypothetical protein